jgi:hypothetical protein
VCTALFNQYGSWNSVGQKSECPTRGQVSLRSQTAGLPCIQQAMRMQFAGGTLNVVSVVSLSKSGEIHK